MSVGWSGASAAWSMEGAQFMAQRSVKPCHVSWIGPGTWLHGRPRPLKVNALDQARSPSTNDWCGSCLKLFCVSKGPPGWLPVSTKQQTHCNRSRNFLDQPTNDSPHRESVRGLEGQDLEVLAVPEGLRQLFQAVAAQAQPIQRKIGANGPKGPKKPTRVAALSEAFEHGGFGRGKPPGTPYGFFGQTPVFGRIARVAMMFGSFA